MREIFAYPLCGAIEREQDFTICRAVQIDQTQADSLKLVDFPKTLSVIVETSCVATFSSNGECLAESEVHSDYYGYLTSFSDPLIWALDRLLRFDCGVDKPFRVEVNLTVDRFYAVPAPASSGGSPQFYSIPHDWIDGSPAARLAAEAWLASPENERYDLRKTVSFIDDKRDRIVTPLWSSDILDPVEAGEYISGAIETLGRGILSPDQLQRRRAGVHTIIADNMASFQARAG